MAEVDL